LCATGENFLAHAHGSSVTCLFEPRELLPPASLSATDATGLGTPRVSLRGVIRAAVLRNGLRYTCQAPSLQEVRADMLLYVSWY